MFPDFETVLPWMKLHAYSPGSMIECHENGKSRYLAFMVSDRFEVYAEMSSGVRMKYMYAYCGRRSNDINEIRTHIEDKHTR